jgi:hypothetical protein
MRETTDKRKSVPSYDVDPSNDDGLNMAEFTGPMRVTGWLVTVTIGGTGSALVALWGKDEAAVWGALGESDGALNANAPSPQLVAGRAYHFFFNHLGIFARLAGRHVVVSGAPTVDVRISDVLQTACGGD